MNAVEILKDEHTYILRMLKVLRKACLDILDGKEVNYELFYNAIDFVRSFADKYHHSKEEDVLFRKMQEELTNIDEISAVQGMFVEHDLGRLYIFNLDKALKEVKNGNREAKLDIIGNVIPYTDLLNRHIHKEDTALYNYGVQALKEESMQEVEIKSKAIDDKPESIKTRTKYITMLEEMEKAVL